MIDHTSFLSKEKQTLLDTIINFISFIHGVVGDLGLIFFMMIVIINLYGIWWILPKKVQVQIKINPAKTKNLGRTLSIHQIFVLSISEAFLMGVIFAPEPVLWLKLFSGILCAIVFAALLVSIIRLSYQHQ